MKKNISLIGSTGSIGVQALEVIERFPGLFTVSGLAARHNAGKLAGQIARFHPREAAITEEKAYESLREMVKGEPVSILQGMEGCRRIARQEEAHLCLVSTVGISGLLPTVDALEHGKTVALATKEVLVAAGSLVMEMAARKGSLIIPVDSEHSALFQCLQGERKEHVRRLILTSSGGPFRGASAAGLAAVTAEQALAHPTWTMGDKITIDSATLMNKGFEVIEAHHLFGIPVDRIEVVVHPQSIIHSLVEFQDGSTLAQMSPPDMRLPIQYALGYPERLPWSWGALDLASVGALTFEKPDMKTFKALRLAYDACAAGGTMPAVLNGANEIAVSAFLNGEIRFPDIGDIVEKTMGAHICTLSPGLPEILEADGWARRHAGLLLQDA